MGLLKFICEPMKIKYRYVGVMIRNGFLITNIAVVNAGGGHSCGGCAQSQVNMNLLT